jgi:hypothetical protein
MQQPLCLRMKSKVLQYGITLLEKICKFRYTVQCTVYIDNYGGARRK